MTTTCPAGHESATDDYCDVCGAVIGPAAPAAAPPPPAAAAEAVWPAAEPVAPKPPASGPACANCGAPHEPGDAFCEVCGLDFATGELPKPPPPPEPVGAEPTGAEPTGAGQAEGEAEGGGAAAEAAPEVDASPEEPASRSGPMTETAEKAETAEPKPMPPPAPGEWYAVVEPDLDWFERNEAEGTAGAVSFPEETTPWELTLTGDEVLIGRRSEARTAQPDLELEDPGVSRRHAVLRRQVDATWTIVDERSTNGTWVDTATDPITPDEPVALIDGSIVHIGAFTRLTIRRA